MPRLRDLLRGDTVDKLTKESLQREALDRIAPHYALLFFDHLYSEYLALKASITDPETIKRLEGLHEKRLKCELTWSDIYSFELTLVHARPLENLIRKAYEARAKYRSIAGQKEYDEYVATKPPNLPEIRIDPQANPPQPEVYIERALRADLEYLLSKVYLYYAILPVRERLRDWLTNRAVLITIAAVVVIGVLIFLNVLLNLIVTTEFKSGANVSVKPTDAYTFGQMLVVLITVFSEMSVVLVTLLTVALAGIVGGCVSMLQRIQSAPSEGDTLFNLAALTNGWKGIFLSPLYGGIFAALLFVLFAAGLLEGSAFPRINTPRRQFNFQVATLPSPSPSPSPISSPSPSPSTSPPPSTSPSTSTSPSPINSRGAAPRVSSAPSLSNSSPDETADDQPSNTPGAGVTLANQPGSDRQPSPAPTPAGAGAVQRLPVLEIKEFLKNTGPADGTSYALLIIWSFIAGFAERLVPDTLNRLVTKNEAIQGTNT